MLAKLNKKKIVKTVGKPTRGSERVKRTIDKE